MLDLGGASTARMTLRSRLSRLDPPSAPLRPRFAAVAVTQRGDARVTVVRDPTELEIAILVNGVRRACVAVHRESHASWVEQLNPVGPGTAELEMGVAENQALLIDPLQELVLVVGGLRHKGAHVRDRRSVAVADAVQGELLGKRVELPYGGRVQRLAAGG